MQAPGILPLTALAAVFCVRVPIESRMTFRARSLAAPRRGTGMLTIRGSQFQALAQGQRDAFERDLVARLQNYYSGDSPDIISRDVLSPRVGRIVERARVHGIDDGPDVTIFVEIAF